MKALHINVITKEITEIDLEKGLQPLYKALECDTFAAVVPRGFPAGDCLYIDDEGLLKEPIGAFTVKGFPQVLSGHGLVVGTDEDGDSADVKLTLDELKEIAEFTSVDQLPEPGFTFISH